MTNVTSGDPEQGCRFAISGVVPVTVSRFVISLYSCRAVIALRWLARRLAGLWVCVRVETWGGKAVQQYIQAATSYRRPFPRTRRTQFF